MIKSFNNSLKMFETARTLIPSCTQTFSKGFTQFSYGAAPIFIQRGIGSHVWDLDKNEYIDYSMALGPVILGHSYPAVNKSISHQLQDGITYSLPHPLEVSLAKRLVEIIPCAEMVRFGKNGSDATSGAVRIARAYTERDKIVCCGYHGWQDWYIGTTTRNKGVPKAVQELTMTFEYNNIESLKKLFDENRDSIAAVIMEPAGVIEPEDGFLKEVKEITHKNGALLIFDEIVTGFRLSFGGAQEYYDVTPDLTCVGKAMANGMPLSAVVGKREVMGLFDDIFFSFTFGGEALSLAASVATINEIEEKNVIVHLWKQGEKLKDGYNSIAKKYDLEERTECIGLPPRTLITFKDSSGNDSLEIKTLFQQEAIKRGILFCGVQNICYSHSDEDIKATLNAYEGAFGVIKKALAEDDIRKYFDGNVIQPVFRKT